MVSQVHLDLTSVGDRIAAEIKDALKDLKIHNDKSLTELADRLAAEFAPALSDFKAEQDSILTAEDIGKSVGTAIGKHLMELDAKITKTGSVIEHLDKDLRNEDASTVVKSPRELEDVRDTGITPVEAFRNAVEFEYGPDAASCDPHTIGELVINEVHSSTHSPKLAPNNTITPLEISKQIGEKVIDHLIKQKIGIAPDAKVACYAAACRYFRERFTIDNVEALLDGVFGLCVQVEAVLDQEWEGSDGTQNAGEMRGGVWYDYGARRKDGAFAKQLLEVLSEQLAEQKHLHGEEAEKCDHSAHEVKQVYDGLDAAALRDQILANVRRLTRLGSVHPTPEIELIVDKDVTFYVASFVVLTHVGEVSDVCRIRETRICRCVAAQSTLKALQSLFEISMKALEDARQHLKDENWLVDRHVKVA
ncbi:hypothetical protein B0A48_15475 [Cryoendolithus antarcticus]|uniref:Uncharacterized protein n=1 Tax=Cryoendolithus antarcticus TaxID=1507870 RepID=A0A1V8SGJ2_9PEZI|nr:hypothetical protein B0A48_15475 [Cryoendolithus antarcticus]